MLNQTFLFINCYILLSLQRRKRMLISLNKLTILFFHFVKRFELVILNALVTLISLGQTVIVTKFLTQEEYGTYGFYLTLSHYIYVIGNWGFLTWGTQSIAADLGDKERIYSTLMRARILTCGVAFVSLLAYIVWVLNSENTFALIGFFIYSMSLILSPEILFIVENRIRTMVLVNLGIKTVYVIVLFCCLLFFDLSPHVVFLLFSILTFSTSLALLKALSFRVEFTNLIRGLSVTPIKLSFPNFLITVLSFVFASAPLILAGSYMDKKYFSVLYASFAIIKMLQAAYNPMIQRIIPRLNEFMVPKDQVFNAVKSDIISAIIFSITCCVMLWLTAPIIVKIVFSSGYKGLEGSIVLFSLALIPGLLSTILISQVAIYLGIVKQAYTALGLVSLVIFSILFFNIENLDPHLVLETMIFGEWVLLLLMVFFTYKKILSLS